MTSLGTSTQESRQTVEESWIRVLEGKDRRHPPSGLGVPHIVSVLLTSTLRDSKKSLGHSPWVEVALPFT